jgi:phosphoribosylformylglycinamidine synthase PurS subunit
MGRAHERTEDGDRSAGGLPMKARVTVSLKSGILDPQGKAIEGALHGLGIEDVVSVRQGKVFDIELATTDAAAAEATLKRACERLLANTVVETYRVEVIA